MFLWSHIANALLNWFLFKGFSTAHFNSYLQLCFYLSKNKIAACFFIYSWKAFSFLPLGYLLAVLFILICSPLYYDGNIQHFSFPAALPLVYGRSTSPDKLMHQPWNCTSSCSKRIYNLNLKTRATLGLLNRCSRVPCSCLTQRRCG